MADHPTFPIQSPGVVVVVAKQTTDGWQMLLLKRSEKSQSGGHWGLVSGTREGSESGPQTARRELTEETALAPTSLWATEHLMQFYYAARDAIWIFPVFVAIVEESAKIQLSDEHTEFRWFFPYQASQVVTWKNMADTIDVIAGELTRFPAKNWVEIR